MCTTSWADLPSVELLKPRRATVEPSLNLNDDHNPKRIQELSWFALEVLSAHVAS